jgi:hypothetical protein
VLNSEDFNLATINTTSKHSHLYCYFNSELFLSIEHAARSGGPALASTPINGCYPLLTFQSDPVVTSGESPIVLKPKSSKTPVCSALAPSAPEVSYVDSLFLLEMQQQHSPRSEPLTSSPTRFEIIDQLMVSFRQCIDAGLVEQRAYPFVNQPGGGKAEVNILLVNDPEYSSDSDVSSDSDNSGNEVSLELQVPDISIAYLSAPVSDVSWVSSHELAVMSEGQTHSSHVPSYDLQTMVIENSVDGLAVMPERDTLDSHRVGNLQDLLSDGRHRIVTDISTIESILVKSQHESAALPGNLNEHNQQRLLNNLSSGSQHLTTSGALYIANRNQLAELDRGPYHGIRDYTELVPLVPGELDISDNSSRNSSDDVGAHQQ